MTRDPSTLDTLDAAECYRLLGTRPVGRLGLVVDGYPVIQPVNFALDDGIIVIRSRPGTKLTALQHANVTFQVDDIDLHRHTGWSVLVRGQAEEVGPDHSVSITAHTRRTALQPWVDGPEFHWVRIIPHGISGRRLVPADLPNWDLGTAAYM